MFKKKEKPRVDNIITITPESVKFSYEEHPEGIPMRCRKNDREYVIRRQEGEADAKQLVIPDHTEHFDPREYGNVLGMPAHRKLFTRRGTLFGNLAPWSLVVAMIIFFIIGIVSNDPAA